MDLAEMETRRHHRARAALDDLYLLLPSHIPPLYEELALSYRWLQIDLDDSVMLLANPPGPSLRGLCEQITDDPVLVEVLFPNGLIPFGRPAGGSYDPICFDTRRRRADGDCPVVRVEHEAILCNGQIGDSWLVAESFRALVQAVITKAE